MTERATTEPVLDVRDLTVVVSGEHGTATVVDGVDLAIAPGEIVGVVGESGAGKSMTALAITRMLPSAATMTGGRILFAGADLAEADERTLRQIRGGQVGMVFQDPLSSLNPVVRVGAQIAEALRLHGSTRRQARTRALELLSLVGIQGGSTAADRYPHEFSGGMRQRVMIAIAVANNPRLLIADEPTTALDVTIQAEVLSLLERLRDELGAAVTLITHDIGVVEQICDRVTVLYGGRVAEAAPVEALATGLRHPYTWQLIRSVPRLDRPRAARLSAIAGSPPHGTEGRSGCLFAARCAFASARCAQQPPLRTAPGVTAEHVAACWEVNDAGRALDPVARPTDAEASDAIGAPGPARAVTAGEAPVVELDDLVIDYRRRRSERGVPAVDGVTLGVRPGRVLGLVGESGSGKTTIARAIVGLVQPARGSVTVAGRRWTDATPQQRVQMRRSVQLVFQDPLASMNPRWRVRQIVGEPLRLVPGGGGRTSAELLELVGLDAGLLDRYPDELSGGQRQRVGIARALAVRPQVIVADEPVSALDVSVQAQVINVLCDLRDEFAVGFVFVAHDLAVARHVCDEVAVMYRGRIVEQGPAEEVLHRPRHPYTRRLVASVPARRTRRRPTEPVPAPETPIDPEVGCRFRDRCPIGPLAHPERTVCAEVDPRLTAGERPHPAACHFAGESSGAAGTAAALVISEVGS
jgi:peptide/nickel transport system ATP-binding protein